MNAPLLIALVSVLWLAGCAAYNMRCDYYHGANPPQCGKYNPEPCAANLR